jgi:amidase
VSIPGPDRDEIVALARELGLGVGAEEAEALQPLVAFALLSWSVLDGLPDTLPPVKWPRDGGAAPEPAENPLGAWAWRVRVSGARSGPLAGRSVALKDNVMLAGVPLVNGSASLAGYVPEIDATIVTRLLDAGATITGKATCENLCLSGGSHTSWPGPVHNPRRHGHSAGGSSSGSAALVAAGEVDLAIGGDQGGSIRMPASFCGVVGMKPTFGLVPYTGILPLEPTLDHAGPITRTVRDNALLLDVIAGPDGIDPRQRDVQVAPATSALDAGAAGLRIAVLREGFGHAHSDPAVDAKVRAAALRFEKLGAQVAEVSLPMHRLSVAVTFPLLAHGFAQVYTADAFGMGRPDLYPPSWLAFQRGARERGDAISASAKVVLLAGLHAQRHLGVRPYGKALRAARRLRDAYDALLAEHDLLLLPTTPMTAPPLPPPDAPAAEMLRLAGEPGVNCGVFDVTHHPALSLPCGLVDGLPVGAMLVGRHFEESTIYRAAQAFEASEDWRRL